MALRTPDSACTYVLTNEVWRNNVSLPVVYTVQASVLTVLFPMSVFGTILNLIFICRNKTNFLMRVFVYLAIAITLLLVLCWLYSLPAFKPDSSMVEFCKVIALPSQGLGIYLEGVIVSVWVIGVLNCSINITLLLKLFNYAQSRCMCLRGQPWRNLSTSNLVGLEILFVIVTMILPLALEVMAIILAQIQLTLVDINTDSLKNVVLSLVCAALLLSFLSYVVLVCWFCARRRQIPRRRAFIKEILLFLMLLAVMLLVGGFSGLILLNLFIQQAEELVAAEAPLQALLALYSLCLFGYMYFSFRREPTGNLRLDPRMDLRTTRLETAPKSNRVSLPSDTAAHAPNFLSPSTAGPSEVTPLIARL